MEKTYKIITAADFLRAKPSGKGDLEKGKAELIEYATKIDPNGEHDLLMDVRDAYYGLGYADVCELISTLERHRQAFRKKIAVVSRVGRQQELSSFLELASGNRGFEVAAFVDFEEAVGWLMSPVEAPEGPQEEEEERREQ